MKNEAMKTLTVSLTRHQIERLKEAIDTGTYASSSEVVRDALRLWEREQNTRELEITHLKKAYDAGMASGKGRRIDPAKWLSDLRSDTSQ